MFFVAEIGSNWEGDIEKAKRLIAECKMAGVDAVKFQMWRADDLYNGKYKEYELDFKTVARLKGFCDGLGIEFFCSVFYPEAVEFLEILGVKRYKLATRTIKGSDRFSNETIKAVIKTGKPVIFSHTPYATSNWLNLYCVSEYPADPEDIDWDALLDTDGFSDHTLGIETALKYCKLNPDGILEKHVKLPDSVGPDAHFSITTDELAELISKVRLNQDLQFSNL